MTSLSFDKIKVRVTINTVITKGSDREQMTNEAFGMMYVNDETAVCTFVERNESGETETLVKVEANKATIQRSGALNMRQQFVMNEKTESFYLTPYGRLMMETKTKTLQFSWNKLKRVGLIHVSYDLWMQHEYTGRYDVTIQMEGVES